MGSLLCQENVVSRRHEIDIIPQILEVKVPRGPRWISGFYTLVNGTMPNGYPLWKSTHADVWIFSMTNGKWGIGGHHQQGEGFLSGAAYVFNDTVHEGLTPDRLPGQWLHNQPAWTPDSGIICRQADASAIPPESENVGKRTRAPKDPSRIRRASTREKEKEEKDNS
mmetsp:Transcript_86500/g.217835  ORF Transcript_86500/g.217835 Transcript_86500/m.217835 type:complete len:167 (+) Transcript_86500:40-540(+)